MGISFRSVMAVSYTHLGYGYIVTIGYDMHKHGLEAFNELVNGIFNDRHVDIAVMGMSLRSVMACSTLVWRLPVNLAMVSLTIGRLQLRLWVYRYDQLWLAIPWSDSCH